MTESQREVDLIDALVQSGVVAEAQLKAAYDYQRSLGGEIPEILVKLGMIRRSKLDAVVSAVESGSSVDGLGSDSSDRRLDPGQIDFSELKVHHRILDKLPGELVDEFLLVLYFPLAKLDSRRLILGHGREVSDELVEAARKKLNVDMYSLELPPAVAASSLIEYLDRAGKPISDELRSLAASSASPPASEDAATGRLDPSPTPSTALDASADESEAPSGSLADSDPDAFSFDGQGEIVTVALIHLLAKKKLIRREELDVEVELERRRRRR